MTTSTITPRKTQETCAPDAAPSSDTWRKCITISAALVTSLLFTGCTDPNWNYAGTAPGLDTPGTTTPAGSPEYQALAQEACSLINTSRSNYSIVTASHNKRTGLVIEDKCIANAYCSNARFTTASKLRHSHKITSVTTRSNTREEWEMHYTTDLKSIAKIEVCKTEDNMNAQGNYILKQGDVTTASTYDHVPWVVRVSQPGIIVESRHNGRPLTYSIHSRYCDLATFDKKSDAERLATVLRKLATLAKQN